MPADYDLLVIGNTAAGRYAAGLARRYSARVALVTQTDQVMPNDGTANLAVLLTTLGVDVVDSMGCFQLGCDRNRHSSLCFVTPHRTLTARHAILAIATQPRIPAIPGLEDVLPLLPTGFRTPLSRTLLAQSYAGQRIGIIGAEPEGLEAAFWLREQGAVVTLWTESASLLSVEDTDLVQALQAQLESLGIECFTETRVKKIRQSSQPRKAANAGLDLAQTIDIETLELVDPGRSFVTTVDQLILASPREANFSPLNLGCLGIDEAEKLPVNSQLQTQNPRVFICGDSLGGYAAPHLGEYEARIAVENALFNRKFQADYRSLPWQLQAFVPLARVGLSEAQAQRRYPKQFQVMRFSWPCVSWMFGADFQTKVPVHLAAFCKLIVHQQGQLLGAHLICPDAANVIVPLAQAIQQKIPVVEIAKTHSIAHSEFEQVRQGIESWLMLHQAQDLRQRDRWEAFFWRSRSSRN